MSIAAPACDRIFPGSRPIIPSETSEKANQEALHWLIALQDDPDDAEILEGFRVWLRSRKENEAAWREAQHVWNVLGETRGAASGVRSVAAHAGSTAARRRGWRAGARYMAVAAAGVAAICLVAVFQPAVSLWMATDYATGTAQIRNVRLEDGSIVHLAADSAIDVAFEAGTRRVRLLSGEAYFEVEPDADRPFRVDANGVQTSVLGTAFDVRMAGEGVFVAVNHGRVAVSADHGEAPLGEPLGAGDWVRVGKGGEVERGNDDSDLVGGWRTGMLVVKDRAVADVVDDIRRYYGGVIVLADGEVAGQRVTGVYDLANPVEALRAVTQAHGANVREFGSRMVMVSRF